MQNRYTFGKSKRLNSKKDIGSLFESGKALLVYPIRSVYRITDRNESSVSDIMVMVSVGKRFHKRAVKRNLLKRRIREAYRLNRPELAVSEGKQLHIALTYISKEVLGYAEIENAVKKSLKDIISAVNSTH